jgi:hypothetical protein
MFLLPARISRYAVGVALRYTRSEVRLDAVEKVATTGAVRVPAMLTRPGVFMYLNDAGDVQREYRPPEEVASAEALATIADMAVTIGHPREGKVTPESYSQLAVGHVQAGSVAPDAAGVQAKLVLARADAIKRVCDSRDLAELSAGYTVRLDATPGLTPAGETYDIIQRDIRYNHVALLPVGAGRLGKECSVRLDSAGDEILPKRKIDTMKLRIDGIEVDGDEAALQAAIDAQQAKIDTLERDRAARDAREAKARRDALEVAAKVHGVTDLAGKSDRQVKEACILRYDSAVVLTERSDAYVDARFDMLTPPKTTAVLPIEVVRLNAERSDAEIDEAAIQKTCVDIANAWRRGR